MQDTNQLIRRLAGGGAPVRRLPAPWVRTAIWCAVSLPYLALVYLVWPKHGASIPSDGRFVLEQTAALLTGLAAAVAAFATVVPGYSKKLAVAPIVPLAVWLAGVGVSCAHDWNTTGSLPPILAHCACLPATLVAAALPAAAILVMLRRGAPLTPHLTTALAALAAAGLGNFGIRFVHTLDTGVVVLIWHQLAVFLLALALALVGDRIVNWRQAIAASGAHLPGV